MSNPSQLLQEEQTKLDQARSKQLAEAMDILNQGDEERRNPNLTGRPVHLQNPGSQESETLSQQILNAIEEDDLVTFTTKL